MWMHIFNIILLENGNVYFWDVLDPWIEFLLRLNLQGNQGSHHYSSSLSTFVHY